jgi:hypothetical protein
MSLHGFLYLSNHGTYQLPCAFKAERHQVLSGRAIAQSPLIRLDPTPVDKSV